MDDLYKGLLKDIGTLRNAEESDVSGMDDFIEPERVSSQLPDRIKVGSLGDLSDFFRIANNTLVHKAEKDLWRISENATDGCVVERLFDPDTKEPIRV